jgi:hypothetical protein
VLGCGPYQQGPVEGPQRAREGPGRVQPMTDKDWFLAEVEGLAETHAARERTTLCGVSVSFPAGLGDPSCPRCRVALGMSSLEDRLGAQYRK